MSAVQVLRDLANQIEAGYVIDGRTLVPIPARDVKVGDRVSECVGAFLMVEAIEPSGTLKADGVTPMLRLTGQVTEAGYEHSFSSRWSVWADDWVVVER